MRECKTICEQCFYRWSLIEARLFMDDYNSEAIDRRDSSKAFVRWLLTVKVVLKTCFLAYFFFGQLLHSTAESLCSTTVFHSSIGTTTSSREVITFQRARCHEANLLFFLAKPSQKNINFVLLRDIHNFSFLPAIMRFLSLSFHQQPVMKA